MLEGEVEAGGFERCEVGSEKTASSLFTIFCIKQIWVKYLTLQHFGGISATFEENHLPYVVRLR